MDATTLLPSHDAMFRWDAPWIEQSPMTKTKVLWVGRETGSWALLGLWKAGYVAGRHKHLAAAYVFVVSGKMASGDVVMTAGDYIYEPSGVMHEATTAIEDTVQLFISLGPIARLDAADGALPASPPGKTSKTCAAHTRTTHKSIKERAVLVQPAL